jgi:hypothetical protein
MQLSINYNWNILIVINDILHILIYHRKVNSNNNANNIIDINLNNNNDDVN